MPVPSFDSLISEETRESITDTLLAVATALGLKTTAWQPGQPIRTFLATVAQKFSDYTRAKRTIVRGMFLTLASGDWLTFTASNRYGTDRRAAEPATGVITMVNTDPATYNVAAGDLIVAHAVTGKTYRNTAAIVLPTGTLTGVSIQADEPGSASNAAPNLVTDLVTTLVGVTITNPAAVIGADEETDAELIARAQESQEATSPMGPKGVYAYVAKTDTYSATSAPITRVSHDLDITTGEVTVYLATATGAPTGGDVAIVQAAIDVWAEPMGFLATAAAAANLTIAVTATVAITTSLTAAEVATTIESALAVYFASLPIGGTVVPPASGYVYRDGIKAAIIAALPGVALVTLTAPAADAAVLPNQVPVLGTVTLTISLL